MDRKGRQAFETFRYFLTKIEIGSDLTGIVKSVESVLGDKRYYDFDFSQIEKGTMDSLSVSANLAGLPQETGSTTIKDIKLLELLQGKTQQLHNVPDGKSSLFQSEDKKALLERNKQDIQTAVEQGFYVPISVLNAYKRESWAQDEQSLRSYIGDNPQV